MTPKRFPRLSVGDTWWWVPTLLMFGGLALVGLWVEGWHPHTRGAFIVIGLNGFLFVRMGWDILTKCVVYEFAESGIQIARWGRVLTEVPWQDYAGWRWMRVSEDKLGGEIVIGFRVKDMPSALLILRKSGASPLQVRFGFTGLAGTLRDGLVVPQSRYRRFLDALREVEPTVGPGWSETSDWHTGSAVGDTGKGATRS